MQHISQAKNIITRFDLKWPRETWNDHMWPGMTLIHLMLRKLEQTGDQKRSDCPHGPRKIKFTGGKRGRCGRDSIQTRTISTSPNSKFIKTVISLQLWLMKMNHINVIFANYLNFYCLFLQSEQFSSTIQIYMLQKRYREHCLKKFSRLPAWELWFICTALLDVVIWLTSRVLLIPNIC